MKMMKPKTSLIIIASSITILAVTYAILYFTGELDRIVDFNECDRHVGYYHPCAN